MDGFHTLVVGDSGTGKTTLLREAFDTFRGFCIWIDHDGAGGISGRSIDDATTVRSVDGLRQADATRIRFQCDDPVAALEAIRPVAKSIYERTGWPVQVVVDEGQDVMPEGADSASGNPLAEMLHQDRDDGVKVLIGTQDPQDLEYGPIKQCRYFVWVGPPSPFHRGFKDHYQLPGGEFPTERFEYVVFERGKTPFQWSAEYRARTAEGYS